MGKTLIIHGADFSDNGMPMGVEEWYMTQGSDYNSKNFSNAFVTTAYYGSPAWTTLCAGHSINAVLVGNCQSACTLTVIVATLNGSGNAATIKATATASVSAGTNKKVILSSPLSIASGDFIAIGVDVTGGISYSNTSGQGLQSMVRLTKDTYVEGTSNNMNLGVDLGYIVE